MDWSWAIQLLIACGLLFILASILWPKLSCEKRQGQPRIPPGPSATAIRRPASPNVRGPYAEQVHRSYGVLFHRWLTPATPPSEANESRADQRRAA